MEKEIVFVTKELKDSLLNLEEGVIEQEEIKGIVSKFKREIELLNDDVEEAAVLFKRHASKTKDKYKEVVDAEVKAMNEFWEVQDERRYEVSEKLNTIREGIRSTKDDLLDLKRLTESINVYGLENLIVLIDKIKNSSLEDKELLQHVFSHNKTN